MSSFDTDVVVVGGGIHGVGVAQACAAAGYEVLLLEKEDFAYGTSSRSSKLIHGGLRYLETAQFGLVHESLTEREILLRVAPSLVRLVPFFIPVYRETKRRPWQIRVGLSLYAVLGRLRESTRFTSVPRSEWDSLDGLRTDGLQAVFRYWDAQTDDEMLTRAVARSAVALGARVLLRTKFVSATRENGGYDVTLETEAGRRDVRCRAIINAAGPWANRLLDAVTPRPPSLAVDLVQGAHIILESEVTGGVYYCEAPSDRRAVFIMPWEGGSMVGTTETPYQGVPDWVQPLPQEIDYLRQTLRHYFPGLDSEPVESFAGLRVLPRGRGSAFHRPRETVLLTDDPREPRLLTLYGGKLTGYRATAAKVVRKLRSSLPDTRPVADTASIPLHCER
jgi:glycerol-3-phosphate dehydrogenase